MVKSNKFEKMIKEQEHQFKLDILEQFCESVHEALVVPDEEGPWHEHVGGKKLQFKRVELVKSFGIIHLHYVDETNQEKLLRLSLELKKA